MSTAGALEGIRVIDLTMWFQGPVAGQHLADLGAEVIHFESPRGGDLGRGVRSIKALPVGDWNQYFLVINRNKKSMAVDLNKVAGREIMHRLVEQADVFLTNLSAAALERWELCYDRLAAINPRLVYAMGSGYGPYGEIKKPSFDLTVQALTGIMARLGEPGQPPIYLGMGSGDAMGGLMAALGIVLALYARKVTGRGQMLDASLYGAQLFLAAPSLQAYLATGDERFSTQQSRYSPENPLWNIYPTKDKWVFLCLENTDENWARLCRSLGAGARRDYDGTRPEHDGTRPEHDGACPEHDGTRPEHDGACHDYEGTRPDHGGGQAEPGPSRGSAKDVPLQDDPRFSSAGARCANTRDLVALLDKVLVRSNAQQWMERWEALDIVASPIRNLAELAEDRQAWENDYLLEAYCEEVKRQVTIRGLPLAFSRTPATVRSLGPELGEATELILAETLGYSWEEIGRLKEEGTIL